MIFKDDHITVTSTHLWKNENTLGPLCRATSEPQPGRQERCGREGAGMHEGRGVHSEVLDPCSLTFSSLNLHVLTYKTEEIKWENSWWAASMVSSNNGAPDSPFLVTPVGGTVGSLNWQIVLKFQLPYDFEQKEQKEARSDRAYTHTHTHTQWICFWP